MVSEFLGVKEMLGTASQVIKAAIEQNLVKLDPSVPNSRKFARYLPIWA